MLHHRWLEAMKRVQQLSAVQSPTSSLDMFICREAHVKCTGMQCILLCRDRILMFDAGESGVEG